VNAESRGSRPVEQPTYKVSALRSGSVIDHLSPGSALQALSVLDVPEGAIITIGMNFESRKHGKKDIVKIEGLELTQHEISRIALLGPNATLSIIRDYEVVQKIKIRLPDTIEDVATCPNPSCITNSDPVPTRFHVLGDDPVRVRCHYCERTIRREEIVLEKAPRRRSPATPD
jgi:aspartate carbamoyltransferase regulatory subunit